MLSELYISNFALIDDVTIKFDKGLNLCTGATGVGKSLIIGALNFLLGSRTTSDIIRTGKKEATVSGSFAIENDHVLNNIKKHIDGFADEEIIIQRSLDHNNRSRCRLNNQPVTVSLLKEIGELLVNIHGQHEHESLTNSANQLIILDSFGKLEALRAEFSGIYKQAIEKERLIHTLKNHQDERIKQIELYQYEINEIESANLKPGELKNLEEERSILTNSEKIQTTISNCFNGLYESDDSLIARLRVIADELSGIADIDKGFENPVEVCINLFTNWKTWLIR